jgi:hypothetical protein
MVHHFLTLNTGRPRIMGAMESFFRLYALPKQGLHLFKMKSDPLLKGTILKMHCIFGYNIQCENKRKDTKLNLGYVYNQHRVKEE